MEKKKPIFVIGTPRSGTTLTAKILGRHSHIFMPGETHYFPDIYAQKRSIGDLGKPEAREELYNLLRTLYKRYNEPEDQLRIDQLLKIPYTANLLHHGLSSYQQALDVFMQIQLEFEGKVRWGNNVPKDIYFVEDILEFYPDAQFILCVRDVRDFLISYKGKWRVTAPEQADRVRRLYHPVVTSLLWKSSMKLVPSLKDLLGKDGLYILKYEELVERPEQVFKSICEYLDENYEHQMLDVVFSNSSEGKGAQGISTESVGKWRVSLSSEEAWIAQFIAGKQLEQLGYKREPLSVRAMQVIWWFLLTPYALWRALKSNRVNTGPILPYLAKRAKSLITS